MTTAALADKLFVPPKQRAVIEQHRISDEGLSWLAEHGYGVAKKMTRATLDLLVRMKLAKLFYREVNHNLILNNGLTYIRDCVRNVQGASSVPAAANIVNGMALGTSATAAVGTQTGILTLITSSYQNFNVDPPAAGGAANQIDWVGFWGASSPPSGPHAIEEVAICPSQALATTQGISRITSGLSLTKQDADTLTITITWTIGTLA